MEKNLFKGNIKKMGENFDFFPWELKKFFSLYFLQINERVITGV